MTNIQQPPRQPPQNTPTDVVLDEAMLTELKTVLDVFFSRGYAAGLKAARAGA